MQLDWSRRNLLLPIERLFWIRFLQSVKRLSFHSDSVSSISSVKNSPANAILNLASDKPDPEKINISLLSGCFICFYFQF